MVMAEALTGVIEPPDSAQPFHLGTETAR